MNVVATKKVNLKAVAVQQIKKKHHSLSLTNLYWLNRIEERSRKLIIVLHQKTLTDLTKINHVFAFHQKKSQ